MLGEQGYQIITGKNELILRAKGEDGLFYGTQTLIQLTLDTDLRRKLGEKGRQSALERYDRNLIVANFIHFLLE